MNLEGACKIKKYNVMTKMKKNKKENEHRYFGEGGKYFPLHPKYLHQNKGTNLSIFSFPSLYNYFLRLSTIFP